MKTTGGLPVLTLTIGAASMFLAGAGLRRRPVNLRPPNGR